MSIKNLDSVYAPPSCATYFSPVDFSCVFTSSTTLTLTGLPFTPEVQNFVYVEVVQSTGRRVLYEAFGEKMTFVAATGVLTVPSATFAAGDLYYRVCIQGSTRAYQAGGNYYQQTEVSPINNLALTETLINTTNTAGATVQLPSSSGMLMLGFSGISFSGQVIDVTSLIVEATDDDSGTLWHQVYFYDCVNNAVINAIASAGVTTNFAISLDNCNFHSVRLTYVTPDATNTLNIRCRRTY